MLRPQVAALQLFTPENIKNFLVLFFLFLQRSLDLEKKDKKEHPLSLTVSARRSLVETVSKGCAFLLFFSRMLDAFFKKKRKKARKKYCFT